MKQALTRCHKHRTSYSELTAHQSLPAVYTYTSTRSQKTAIQSKKKVEKSTQMCKFQQ